VAVAKEPTRKLIISGADLAGVVELTDSTTLALSDIYGGTFLDASREVAPPAPNLPRYEISFYLPDHRGSLLGRVFGRPRFYRAYVVYFTPDIAGRAGYVYLPGAGDTWASWNHGVIIRSDREGRWSRASRAWGERIADAIAHARRRPPPSCPAQGDVGRLQPGDPVYRDVSELAAVLEAHGLHVLCTYHTTLAGVLGEFHAAGVMTDLGPFAVFFFPPPAGAESVRVSSTVKDGQLLTVLRGPNAQRPVDSLYSADKTDILVHKRWLFDTFGQLPLRAALRAAVGAP
jgi:hypothetical protein